MPKELEALRLAEELQEELAGALNSLGDKEGRGLHDNYFFYSASHINIVSETFCLLCRQGRLDGAKFLVRPAIEMVLRIEAIRRKPELLFQIAYTERTNDRKWFRAAAQRAGLEFDERAEEQRWNEFKAMYQAQCPSHALFETVLSTWDIAKEAQLTAYYDSLYRLYCQYEHGAFAATTGWLQDLSDSADARTIAFSAFVAANSLVSVGAEAPRIHGLFDRLSQLDDAVKE